MLVINHTKPQIDADRYSICVECVCTTRIIDNQPWRRRGYLAGHLEIRPENVRPYQTCTRIDYDTNTQAGRRAWKPEAQASEKHDASADYQAIGRSTRTAFEENGRIQLRAVKQAGHVEARIRITKSRLGNAQVIECGCSAAYARCSLAPRGNVQRCNDNRQQPDRWDDVSGYQDQQDFVSHILPADPDRQGRGWTWSR